MKGDPTPSGIFILLIILSILSFSVLTVLVFKIFVSYGGRRDYGLIGDDFFGFGDVPHEFVNDEEALKDLAEEFDFTSLSPHEQEAYLRGEEFTKNHPPKFENTRGKSFTHEDDLVIKDCGILAFEFEQEADILQARYVVADKTEVHFIHNDTPYSTATSILNYSLPVKNRTYSDTIYFEVKVFEFDPDTYKNGHFAIGLVTKPYPLSFRLPGYNNFSIAYESTGNLKINKPFPTPLQQHLGENSKFNAQVLPPLQQSDIIGFGYVVSSGTIFITRNGKKVMDVMKGCFVDLYPAIGCFSANAKFQANIGQLGYVWIEANVRKYGFISTSDYKKMRGDRGLASLPEYGNIGLQDGDRLLDKGEELPPDYPEDELDFFGRSSKDLVRVGSSSKSQRNAARNLTDIEKDELKLELATHAEGIEDDEVKDTLHHSSSIVTNEPEEIMDLRERLYEHNVTPKKIDENTPLISNIRRELSPIRSQQLVSSGESGNNSERSSTQTPEPHPHESSTSNLKKKKGASKKKKSTKKKNKKK